MTIPPLPFPFTQGFQESTFLYSFFDSLPLGVLIIDVAGTIVYCNEAQARIDDMPREFMIGRFETEIYGPYVGPGIVRSCQMTGKPILGYICHYRTARGKIINGAYWVYPLYQDGDVVASICLTQMMAAKNPLFPVTQQLQDTDLQGVAEASFAVETKDKEGSAEPMRIVGSNPAFRRMLSVAETTASSPSPVMICGETGCGKEMIVKAIRAASNRCDKPYLAINCSAIPATLLESILFGAVKGSFTGAIDRPGLFEEANGGIIYLDEIDSMPLELQPKLLRVLQDMRVRRLGASVERAINVKVICSIGTAPEVLLDSGRLRPDLFYRLAVIMLRIPPLRERKEDIMDLAAHFMAKYNTLLKKNIASMDAAVADLFQSYDWPGNVRELEHVIAGAINLSAWEKVLHLHHIPEHLRLFVERQRSGFDSLQSEEGVWAPVSSVVNLAQASQATLPMTEEERIRAALTKTSGHISNAGRILGMSRQLMGYKMKKFGIRKEDFVVSF